MRHVRKPYRSGSYSSDILSLGAFEALEPRVLLSVSTPEDEALFIPADLVDPYPAEIDMPLIEEGEGGEYIEEYVGEYEDGVTFEYTEEDGEVYWTIDDIDWQDWLDEIVIEDWGNWSEWEDPMVTGEDFDWGTVEITTFEDGEMPEGWVDEYVWIGDEGIPEGEWVEDGSLDYPQDWVKRGDGGIFYAYCGGAVDPEIYAFRNVDGVADDVVVADDETAEVTVYAEEGADSGEVYYYATTADVETAAAEPVESEEPVAADRVAAAPEFLTIASTRDESLLGGEQELLGADKKLW